MERKNGSEEWADMVMNDPDFVMDEYEQWQVYDFALSDVPHSPSEAVANFEEIRCIAQTHPDLFMVLAGEVDFLDIPKVFKSLQQAESGIGLTEITFQD